MAFSLSVRIFVHTATVDSTTENPMSISMISNSWNMLTKVTRVMTDTMMYSRNPAATLKPIHSRKYFMKASPLQFLWIYFKFTGNMIHLFPRFFHLSQLIVLREIEGLDEP